MIIDIYKDYNVDELSKFAETSPKRYIILCAIVGEFALAVRQLYLGVVLPYNSDKGCVTVSVLKDNIVNVIDTRYF